MKTKLHIGTSGWSYPDWEGIFYPKGADRKFNRLEYYAQYFDTVEVNTSFYRPPNPNYCEKWLRDVSENPRFMSLRGGECVLRELFIPASSLLYPASVAVIERLRPVAVVAHPTCLALTWAAREAGLPLAVVHLAPTTLLSPAATRGLPMWKRAAYRLLVPLLSRLADRWLRPVCREVGYPWRKGLFLDSFLKADLLLGLWSPQVWSAEAEDELSVEVCGFPKAPTGALPESLAGFLEAGPPPVVVSFGSSAVNIAGPIYRSAAEALVRTGRRGVLLVGRNTVGDLPETVVSLPAAPHGSLLPRCAALVHHGGIGTSAAAMLAGVPGLVVPFGHDQFDNADHAARLGVARAVSRRRCSPAVLARRLEALLAGDAPERARALAARLAGERDGVVQAAAAVAATLCPGLDSR